MKEDFIAITLPMWPSVNWLFSWKVRRYKSDEYKRWLQLADIEFNKIETTYKITGDSWLYVELHYFFSLYTLKWNKRVKDTSNYEKAVCDYLSTKIEGFEDHKVKRIIQEKHDSDKNIVKIIVKEYEK
jgi:Holliday junction resolvase RusA-like endonuclease